MLHVLKFGIIVKIGIKIFSSPQARRLKQALLDRGHTEGVEFEYVELEGQGHYPFSVPEKKEKWQYILDFLDRRL